MKILALIGSPRRGGNTQVLVEQIVAGAESTGTHRAETLFLDEYVKESIRDCRLCRTEKKECSINDRYAELLDAVLECDCLILGSPLYWYGPSGLVKNFIDRWFCYISDSYPEYRKVLAGMRGKKIILAVACEESGPMTTGYLIGMISETIRYMKMQLVSVVLGDHSVRRGDIKKNQLSLQNAHWVGSHIDQLEQRKYDVDSERPVSLAEQ